MPENSWIKPNYWLSVIVLKGYETNLLIDKLENENIESRPVWKPMHLQPVFQSYDYIGDQFSQNLFENGICLPSDTKMSDDQLMKVADVIKGSLAQ